MPLIWICLSYFFLDCGSLPSTFVEKPPSHICYALLSWCVAQQCRFSLHPHIEYVALRPRRTFNNCDYKTSDTFQIIDISRSLADICISFVCTRNLPRVPRRVHSPVTSPAWHSLCRSEVVTRVMSPSILFLFSRDGYIVSFNGMIFETKPVITLSFQQWFKKNTPSVYQIGFYECIWFNYTGDYGEVGGIHAIYFIITSYVYYFFNRNKRNFLYNICNS